MLHTPLHLPLSLPRQLLVCALLACAVTPIVRAQVPATPAPATASVQRGYLSGQVIDKATARPLPATNIVVVGTTLRTQTDLDGRYRLPVPVGVYAVRAFRLGNMAQQIEAVRITAGTSTTVNFALGSAVVQLQAQRVTAAPTKANSEDALLAMQRASSRVSDGISAEAIKRTPGSNAGDAVVRVTGVSIVDGKFAVVRGLAERYSNTLLNGVELPSPEPQKKIVPLDIFPSSLLESIVVSKTATPDKPGDFAGGSVEVTTKEFPNTTVADVNVTTGYNSVTTFQSIAHAPRRGIDYLGFDAGGRRPTAPLPPQGPETPANEIFAEGVRNVWTPAPRPIAPNFGATANLGGRFGGASAPFGYVLSANLNSETQAVPDRFFQNIFLANGNPENQLTLSQATTATDLGVIANFAARLGSSNKIGVKNLFSRNAEELLSEGFGGTSGTFTRVHQVRYITRTLRQSQLSGDHVLNWLLGSRLEWKATTAVAERDEPENRALQYQRGAADSVFRLNPLAPGSRFWIRNLKDEVRTGQVDFSAPLPRLRGDGSIVKVGALARQRQRAFDGIVFSTLLQGVDPGAAWLELPAERVFTPELLGPSLFRLRREGTRTLPYESQDNVTAVYGMVDLPLRSWLRVVAGVRNESWALDIYLPRRDTLPPTTTRRNSDLLPSVNTTFKLTERQNLRLAAYETVARPDPREVTSDAYEAVSGECSSIGNPALTRTRIRNADVRWERYPKAGEVLSLSAFVKDFTDPIVEFLGTDAGDCYIQPANAINARVTGGELEFRQGLTALPGLLKRVSLGVNVTVVRSRATARVTADTVRTLQLQGQSDRLVNTSLLYSSSDGGFEAGILANYFSDRIARYGDVIVSGEGAEVLPDVFEKGRLTVDARLRKRLGRANVTMSLRNLTDNEVRFTQQTERGNLVVGYLRQGISVRMGVGYAIR